MTRKPTTLYLEWETYQRFKDAVSRLGKSASQEINDYIRRQLAGTLGRRKRRPTPIHNVLGAGEGEAGNRA